MDVDQTTERANVQSAVVSGIIAVLPELGPIVASNVAKKLSEMGMSSTDHLRLVREQDLEGYMLPFQARLLLESWGKDKGPLHIPEQRNHESHSPDPDPWNVQIDWADVYRINKDMKTKLTQGKKLKRKEKRELVRKLVQQVRDKMPNATRSSFIDIATQLKKKYSTTFASELANGKLGKRTIGKRMMDKFDNDKRPKRRTTTEKEAPAIKQAYGCIKWRLAKLPDGQTPETQNQKRQELEEYYEQTRPSAYNWTYINSAMDLTYGTLRAELNKQAEEICRLKKQQNKENRRKGKPQERQNEEQEDDPESMQLTLTEDLRARWPFLFQPKAMLHHFEQLTGTDLAKTWDHFLKEDAEKLLEFLFATTKKKKHIKKFWKQNNKERDSLVEAESKETHRKNTNLAAVLSLLLKRFKEKKNNVWKIIDSCAREDDITEYCVIPKAPNLIIAGGDIFNPGKIFFSMDGTVLGTACDLEQGVGLLFASYYVFNVVYASDAQVTLEFIQRCVTGIDPPRGNKRPNKEAGGRFSSRKIHPALESLNEKYDEYFAEKDDSDSSSDLEEDD